jgi:hypothetical protein
MLRAEPSLEYRRYDGWNLDYLDAVAVEVVSDG